MEVSAASTYPLESMVEVINFSTWHEFDLKFTNHLTIPNFEVSNGMIIPPICFYGTGDGDGTNLTFSPIAAYAIYHALVLAAPEGMYLLPCEEAIKPLLKESV